MRLPRGGVWWFSWSPAPISLGKPVLCRGDWPLDRTLDELLSDEFLENARERLRKIRIGYSECSGQIPDKLYDCRRLEMISLEKSKLSGTISEKV